MRLTTQRTKIAYATVYLAGVVLITILCGHSYLQVMQKAHSQIRYDANQVKRILEDEMDQYLYGLQGTRGSFIASNYKFDPKAFRVYAESRDLYSNFTGSLGFGFIRYIRHQELKKYLTKLQNQPLKTKIYPDIYSENMVVELIEPIEVNQKAIGLNIAFEEKRRTTALKSAETGKPLLTPPISLVLNSTAHTGFLYLMPIYSAVKTPLTTSDRMSKLIGWVFAPIVLEDVIAKVKHKIPSGLAIDININNEKTIQLSSNPYEEPNKYLVQSIEVPISAYGWRLSVQRFSGETNKAIYSLALIYLLSILVFTFVGKLIYQSSLNKDKSILEQASWLTALIEGAGHAVIATTPDGIITTFNTAAEKLLGYTNKEVIGKWTPLIFHDFDELKIRAEEISINQKIPIQPGFESFIMKSKLGESDISEWTYITKDRRRVPIKLCLTAIYNQEKKLIGFLGIAEDLSEAKKLLETIEEQRAQMQESAKLSLLGEMAGGIAHEINTPLAIILAKSELITDRIKKQKIDLPAIVENLNKISSTAIRIGKIVRGLRDFSRNSTNDPMVSVQLSEVIDSTLELCREKTQHQGIDLIIEGFSSNTTCTGRSAELGQVFMNLISNSIDAIEKLPQKWIKIKFTTTDSFQKIYFIDSGNGIAKSVVEKMMNPFFTTKEVGKGTGLGLSISRGIIESYRGKLYYDPSSPNTCFIIELPLQSEAKKIA